MDGYNLGNVFLDKLNILFGVVYKKDGCMRIFPRQLLEIYKFGFSCG